MDQLWGRRGHTHTLYLSAEDVLIQLLRSIQCRMILQINNTGTKHLSQHLSPSIVTYLEEKTDKKIDIKYCRSCD